MISWQIKEPKNIEQNPGKESIETVDDFKIKMTKVLLTQADFDLFSGDAVCNYPIVPGVFAVGEVVEMGNPNNNYGIKLLDKVCLNPVTALGEDSFNDFDNQRKIAGKTVDGFLKDFTVVNTDGLVPIPENINPDDAIFVEFISICLETMDIMKIQKGEHVAIIGSNVLGNIFAQIITYYQGVPILIDGNEQNLEIAKKCGIYYTLKSGTTLQKEVCDITGGKMANKVVYITDSGLNSDIALKIASNNANVGFVGFGNSKTRISCALAMQKQLDISFISDGFGKTETSLNLILNKAVDLSYFNIKTVAFSDVKKVFVSSNDDEEYENTVLVDFNENAL